MGGQRMHRLLFVCLSVFLAGVLAAAVKVTPSPDRTRVASIDGPSSVERALKPAPPALPVAIAPPPRSERPIQSLEDSPDAGTTSTEIAPFLNSAFHDRSPVLPGATTDAAKTVFGLIIGINDYPGDSYDLHGAVPDAEDMADVLAMYGVPQSNVRVLLDGDA